MNTKLYGNANWTKRPAALSQELKDKAQAKRVRRKNTKLANVVHSSGSYI